MENEKMSLDDFLTSMGFKPFDPVAKAVAIAYCDGLPDNVDTSGLNRNLDFFQRTTVLGKDLSLYLMIIGEYNQFVPQKVAKKIVETFGSEAQVIIAREGSPCLYIRPSKNVDFNGKSRAFGCDDFRYESALNMFRLWWD